MDFSLPTPLDLLMEIKSRNLNKPPILFDDEMENLFINKFSVYYHTEPLEYESTYPHMCVIEILDDDITTSEKLQSYNKWVHSFNKLAKSLDVPVACEIIKEMRHVFEDYPDLLADYPAEPMEIEHRIIIKIA